MNNGWVKLYRGLTEKAFYSSDSERVHLWIHLLLKANHSGKEEMFGGKPILCKPGQFTIGRKQLAEETGINESKIERTLTYFEKSEQQIEQRKSNTNRLITILNWDEFQASEQQSEQRVNNERTTSEQRVNTLQECKEGEECKEKEISTIVDTKKSEEERLAELARKREDQKKKSDAAKAATIKRKELFREELSPYIVRYGQDMIQKFFEYWTEQNRSGTKMKFELQKTWDLAMRLGTWNNREPIGNQQTLFSGQSKGYTPPSKSNLRTNKEGYELQ